MKTIFINLWDLELPNWDKQTMEAVIFIQGGGNMWGGWANYAHVVIHGENSSKQTGEVELRGVLIGGYNIARGANGESYDAIEYFPGLDNFDTHEKKPEFAVKVEGKSGGAIAAAKSLLRAESVYVTEYFREHAV